MRPVVYVLHVCGSVVLWFCVSHLVKIIQTKTDQLLVLVAMTVCTLLWRHKISFTAWRHGWRSNKQANKQPPIYTICRYILQFVFNLIHVLRFVAKIEKLKNCFRSDLRKFNTKRNCYNLNSSQKKHNRQNSVDYLSKEWRARVFEEAEASELEDLLEDKISSLQRRVRESQQGDWVGPGDP